MSRKRLLKRESDLRCLEVLPRKKEGTGGLRFKKKRGYKRMKKAN